MDNEELVRLLYVDGLQEAESYKTQLEDRDIPVELCEEVQNQDHLSEIAIMVPADLIEDAEYAIQELSDLNDELLHEYATFDELDAEDTDDDEFSDLSPLDNNAMKLEELSELDELDKEEEEEIESGNDDITFEVDFDD